MKESKLTTYPERKPKRIEIDIEKKVSMVIEREEGKDPKVTGPNIIGPVDDPGVDFNHPPPDTVIFTYHSPGCGYYYFGGKWWYR